MEQFKHSVQLMIDKCKGCTTCLKRCPTEAIRIQDGHSVINENLCIDCGECIRVCPYQAKNASFDEFEKFKDYKYKIALPAPALYGQFDNLDDIDYIITGLYKCGFDEVAEVARAAELVSVYTRKYLRREDIKKPVISTACPAITRLISIRFPLLRDNLLPMLPPVELAAVIAKEEALAIHPELKEEDICALFISPCPAKVSYVRNPIGTEKSKIDGVLSMSDFYFRLLSKMNQTKEITHTAKTGIIGMSWAASGGEASALFNEKYLAADGIENVIKVLEEIENGNFSGLEFVELNACNGGCVGGALTVENPYIAKARLQTLRRYLPVSCTSATGDNSDTYIPDTYMWSSEVPYAPIGQLSSNMGEAMRIMNEIQILYNKFPHIDCGACGAPTCRALAEDIAQNGGSENQCLFVMREKLAQLDNVTSILKNDKE